MDKALLCSENPGWQVIEIIFGFFVLRISNGECCHGAVTHAQDDATPICRGLHRLQLCLFKDNDEKEKRLTVLDTSPPNPHDTNCNIDSISTITLTCLNNNWS